MGLLKKLKLTIIFFTIFPVKTEIESYDEIAEGLWLSPVVGWILGLILSGIALILFRFLPDLLVGFLILGLIIYLTGAHHVDGLLDFGDGIMARKTPEEKIAVMHDVSVGAGGFSLGLIVLIITGISIAFSKSMIITSLIIAEISAKNAMVAACSLGKSAGTKMATPFIEKNKCKHLGLSLIISGIFVLLTVFISFIYSSLLVNFSILTNFLISINEVLVWDYYKIAIFILVFLISTFVPVILMLRIANKNFNGLTGDCLGALNEITRAFSLVILLLFNSLTLI